MLKQRIITALVLVSIVIGAIFFAPFYVFVILATLFFVVAAWEWGQFSHFSGLLRILYSAVVLIFMLLVASLCGLGIVELYDSVKSPDVNHNLLLASEKIQWVVGAAVLWWLIAIVLVKQYPQKTDHWNNRWLQSIIGLLIIIPTWIGLIFLHQQEKGSWLIVIVVASVVCADTGAYFVGRRFGKNKLAPHVSPGKSKEGFYGGFICSLVFALALILSLGGDLNDWWLLAMIVPTSLMSVLGDLLESMFKRERGIKDSGKILPGHGGVLDRIDSITAAIPIFTLAFILSGWQL